MPSITVVLDQPKITAVTGIGTLFFFRRALASLSAGSREKSSVRFEMQWPEELSTIGIANDLQYMVLYLLQI